MSQILSKNIYFKRIPKYEIMMKIVKPTIIEEINGFGSYVYFDYNPYPVKTLIDQKSFSSLRTQLRFCYLTYDQTEVKDCGPEHLNISLNGNIIYSFNEESDNKIKEPIDLSKHLSHSNVLRFWMNKPDIIWSIPTAYEISLVKTHSPQSIFNTITNNHIQYLSNDYTKALIKKRLSNCRQSTSDEIEILTQSLKCKLLCPISGSRIEIPCRTNTCQHIQCFDLFSFLKMFDTKYDWLCPICNTLAMPHLLKIDRYFTDILRQTDQSLDEIQFNSDHQWIAYISVSESDNILEKPITLDDDSFLESVKDSKPSLGENDKKKFKFSVKHKSDYNLNKVKPNIINCDFKRKSICLDYDEVEKIRK